MPIVGQFGSLAGFGVFPGGALESIATVTVGSGGASSITFSDLPSGFQHLHVRGLLIGVSANDAGARLNQDSSATAYSWHRLNGNGASATATAGTSTNNSYAAVYTTTYGAAFCMDILDVSSTSKNKTMRMFGGWDANGSGQVFLHSGLYMSTSAVNAVTIFGVSNFAQHSTLALYGVRA
jgi:hypothetical protein